jgi:hypothetical protein
MRHPSLKFFEFEFGPMEIFVLSDDPEVLWFDERESVP